jgi:uncharacterized OB-fold protein
VTQADYRPPANPTTEPFWEATRARRLLLQHCRDCRRPVHHPREACPHCLGHDLDWAESHGGGVVHAVSVHHRPFEVMDADECPYVVAFVDLDDGVRYLSNIVGPGRLDASVGDRVSLAWTAVADGYHLPVFTLVSARAEATDHG